MNSSYQTAIKSAESVDQVVELVREKYSDSKTVLGGDDWLFEYSILNWGTAFFRPYQALMQMQESLKENIGNFGISDYHVNGSSMSNFINDYSQRVDDISGRRIVIFQVSSSLLVPCEIKRLPSSNYERPNGYKIDMGMGIEPEILIFEFKEGGSWGYLKDSEGLLIEDDQMVKYLKKVTDNQFESSTPSVLIGLKRSQAHYFGSKAEEKIVEWLKQNGYKKGEQPIEFIQRQKGRSSRRADFYPPII